jgi:hypothetical protein
MSAPTVEFLQRRAAGKSETAVARELGISRPRVRIVVPRAKAAAYDALVAEGKAPPTVLDGKGSAVHRRREPRRSAGQRGDHRDQPLVKVSNRVAIR